MTKKHTCPNCGEPLKRVRIVYGLPTAEFADQVARGEVDVVLAGCVIGPDDPKWACAACREPLRSRPSVPRDDVPQFRLVE